MALTYGVGDLIEVRLNYRMTEDPGTRAMNVLHYSVTASSPGPPDVPDVLQLIASAAQTKFAPLWQAMASNEVRMSSVTAQSVYPLPRSRAVTEVPGAPLPGLVDDDALPLQDAPTILKLTAVGTRWGLGRVFVPGLPESLQTSGILTAEGVTAVEAWAPKFAETITFVVGGWSTTLAPVLVRGPTDNPVSLTRITSAILSDEIIKTQRRRRPGKGG